MSFFGILLAPLTYPSISHHHFPEDKNAWTLNPEFQTLNRQFLEDKDAVLASSTLVDSARGIWEGYRTEMMDAGLGEGFGIDDISAVVVFF
jgi:hypothetical protein